MMNNDADADRGTGPGDDAGWLRPLKRWPAFAKTSPPRLDALITSMDYDAQSRLRRVTKPDGTFIIVLYDPAGRVAGLQDQDGNAIKNVRDTEGHQLAMTVLRDSQRAPLDIMTTYEFDAQNRLSRVHEATGAVTRYRYDPWTGQIGSITDALERNTSFAYDDSGQLAAILRTSAEQDQGSRRPVPLVSQGSYADRQVIVAGNGAETHRQRDDFDRIVVIVNPDSGTQFARYDAADRLTLTVDGRGNRTGYVYDAAGAMVERITTGKASDGASAEEHVTYRYEGALLVGMSNAHQSSEYSYDKNSRLVKQVDHIFTVEGRPNLAASATNARPALRFVRRYTYDRLGRLKTQTLADGEMLVLSYNASGRLHEIGLRSSDGETVQPIVANIEEQRFTGLVGFVHGNGVSTRYETDKHTGQLKGIRVDGPARKPEPYPLYAQLIDYDIAGRILRVTRSGSSQEQGETERFGYDLFDRLSRAETRLHRATWRYDQAGNRLSQIVAPVGADEPVLGQSLQYAAGSNRLVRLAAAGEVKDYEYDAAGNPLRIGRLSYRYGVTGRLERIRQGQAEIAHYAYNAQGERVAKTAIDAHGKRSNTYFLYQGQKIQAEINDDGSMIAQYIYLGHIPVAKLDYAPSNSNERNGTASVQPTFNVIQNWFRHAGQKRSIPGVYAIHTDHLGTPQLATDSRQRIVWNARYTAFGSAQISVQKIALNLRLPGQYFDMETGTHYNYFRNYDPETGRYLTSDPLGIEGGINTYSYAAEDPIKKADPLGLKVWLAERAIDAPLVGWIGGHTWLILEPDHPEELKKYYPGIIPWSRKNPKRITLRGGPSEIGTNGNYGRLIKDTYTDSPDEWRQRYEVGSPDYHACFRYSDDTQFIIDVLEAYNVYGDNLLYDPTAGDRSLPYKGFPALPSDAEYYNSNSFSAGLLIAAGVDKNKVPNPWGAQPGITKPIPLPSTKGP
jgi:RHS repeat-associated protein